MQSAIFKFAALAGVIGIGCFVVLEVHKRLPTPQAQSPEPNEFSRLDDSLAVADDHERRIDPGSTNDGLPPQNQFEPGDDVPFEPVPGRRVALRGDPGADAAPRWPSENDGSESIPIDASGFDLPAGAESDEFARDVSADVDWPELPSQPGEPAVAATDNPFVAEIGEASLQPLPGEELEPSFFPTLDGDELDPLPAYSAESIRPVADEQFSESAEAFNPFARDSSLAEAASPEAGPVMDLFGPAAETEELDAARESDAGNPFGLAEPREPVEPLLFPADPRDAGFTETSPPPEAPEVEGNPFGSDAPFDTPDADPIMPVDAEAFNPFGEPEPFAGDESEENTPRVLELPTEDKPREPGLVLPLAEPAELPFANSPALPTPVGEASEMPIIRSQRPGPTFDLSPGDAASGLPDVRPAVRPLPVDGLDQEPAAQPEYVGDGTLTADAPTGSQQPELTIEKVAPPAASVGEPLIYAIKIRNVGKNTAHDVIIEDRIPRGTTLDGTIPQAELIDKRLVWRLGDVQPGQEELIRIRVVPTEAGEIGSVATVRFVAQVSAATVISSPDLSLAMNGPTEVVVGEQAVFQFRIANNGASDARNVYIENVLPSGLEHPGGQAIERDLGVLSAGESRDIELAVTAVAAGPATSRAYIKIGSTTYASAEADFSVIESRLTVERQGPSRRFVGRPADYVTLVSNKSGATLRQVRVVEQLPEGLELAGIPQGGKFDPVKRTITWTIPELPAGQSKKFATSVVAQTVGTMQSVVRANDADGNAAELRSRLEVAGFESLALDLEHDGRPVLVGEQVALRITVKNRGTGPARNVRAAFEFPAHLEFVDATGSDEYRQQGRMIEFATISELAADEERSFDIVLTAAESGVVRVTAQLETPTLGAPLRHDEAIVIQADEP